MYEFQVFKGRDGLWYWRLWSVGNSRSIATGGESYYSEDNARRAIALVKSVAPMAAIRTL